MPGAQIGEQIAEVLEDKKAVGCSCIIHTQVTSVLHAFPIICTLFSFAVNDDAYPSN